MLDRVSRAARRLLTSNPITLGKELRHRWYTNHYERKFGVETAGVFQQSELGYVNSDGKLSSPIGYEHMFWALNRIPFPATEVEMMDFGAGLGRAVVSAATLPFKSVTGVELSHKLASRAKLNVERMQGRRAGRAEIIEGNVLTVPIPPTTNVFYYFNPFEGETLERSIERIRISLEQNPRKAFLIFFNHKHMEKLAQGKDWIRKVYDGEFYPQYGCGLYELEVRATAKARAAGA